jgi:hypothetical protein
MTAAIPRIQKGSGYMQKKTSDSIIEETIESNKNMSPYPMIGKTAFDDIDNL